MADKSHSSRENTPSRSRLPAHRSNDMQTFFQRHPVLHVVGCHMSEGKKSQFLQNAIELVQQIALAGENTLTGQVFEFFA